MKTNITLLTCAALLAGCASVSDSLPTVKVEKRKPKATAQSASFVTNAASSQTSMICETTEMRAKVMDDDDDNDAVRLMVVEDGAAGSRVLSEVEVDCRNYFLRKSLAPSPRIIRAATPETTRVVAPRKKDSRYTYIVQKGDTVWDIAREHCTTVKDISRLNGLGRGNVLDIGQRLKLPDTDCE